MGIFFDQEFLHPRVLEDQDDVTRFLEATHSLTVWAGQNGVNYWIQQQIRRTELQYPDINTAWQGLQLVFLACFFNADQLRSPTRMLSLPMDTSTMPMIADLAYLFSQPQGYRAFTQLSAALGMTIDEDPVLFFGRNLRALAQIQPMQANYSPLAGGQLTSERQVLVRELSAVERIDPGQLSRHDPDRQIASSHPLSELITRNLTITEEMIDEVLQALREHNQLTSDQMPSRHEVRQMIERHFWGLVNPARTAITSAPALETLKDALARKQAQRAASIARQFQFSPRDQTSDVIFEAPQPGQSQLARTVVPAMAALRYDDARNLNLIAPTHPANPRAPDGRIWIVSEHQASLYAALQLNVEIIDPSGQAAYQRPRFLIETADTVLKDIRSLSFNDLIKILQLKYQQIVALSQRETVHLDNATGLAIIQSQGNYYPRFEDLCLAIYVKSSTLNGPLGFDRAITAATWPQIAADLASLGPASLTFYGFNSKYFAV